MGHGMQKMCKDLLSDWGNTTVILSPLNISPDRIQKFASTIKKANGNILFDPQMYFPRKNHKNLSQYKYWPKKNITFFEDGECKSQINDLYDLNNDLSTSGFILPSSIASKIDHIWDALQRNYIQIAKSYNPTCSLISTIALTGDVLLDNIQVETIIQYVETWDVDSVYIVCEHPDRYYFITKPLWLSNLLSLVAGIKRQKKKVIVGYASQQMLCLSLAKCDVIASGNFLNVRWFTPEHFETTIGDTYIRRALWYYCPQSLSEFKVPFLDIAQRMNILDKMKPNKMNPYCSMLFSGSIPSSTGYSEADTQKHYLTCLREQSLMVTRTTYNETRDAQELLLETAEQLLTGFRNKGIRGQDRDFSEIIDVNRAAIALFDSEFGYSLSREWDEL